IPIVSSKVTMNRVILHPSRVRAPNWSIELRITRVLPFLNRTAPTSRKIRQKLTAQSFGKIMSENYALLDLGRRNPHILRIFWGDREFRDGTKNRRSREKGKGKPAPVAESAT